MALREVASRHRLLATALWLITVAACLTIFQYRVVLVRITRAGILLLQPSTIPGDLRGVAKKAERSSATPATMWAAPPPVAAAAAAAPATAAPATAAPWTAAPVTAAPWTPAPTPAPTPPPPPPPPAESQYVAKYGFYMHVFNSPPAVASQVDQIQKFFPGSPIYIMSDGGMQFDGLCKEKGCTFQLCPPANDRWHPWPFFRRFYDAAVSLKTEFVIMLEPDNTIHGPITRHPKHGQDAGGLFVRDRSFRLTDYVNKMAAKAGRPNFRWTRRMMSTGLCGGSYYRTAAVLDAFSDEAIAAIDWNFVAERESKEVFSSDFAMPYALAARGWNAEPWDDAAQWEEKEKPRSGPPDAAFRHYGGGYPGGKPTYNLRLPAAQERKYARQPLDLHNRFNTNCQVCWNLATYKSHFGSDKCTNKLDFKYSDELRRRYPGR